MLKTISILSSNNDFFIKIREIPLKNNSKVIVSEPYDNNLQNLINSFKESGKIYQESQI